MKKLLMLIIATLASSLLLYVLVSRDQQARHPGLKTAALPQLLALHDMMAASDASPDHLPLFGLGTMVAWQQGEAAKANFEPQLTTPLANSSEGPLPTVLVIDSAASGVSGPDTAETVRFLVNRGYVVLQVDCRFIGNAGRAAGDGMPATLGSCTETTIVEEAHKLIQQGIVDPEALAVLGSGSGGTLALRAMSVEPGLFKAAIIHSPARIQADHLYTGAVPEKLIRTKVKASAGSMGLNEPLSRLPDKSLIELMDSLQGALLMTRGDGGTAASLDRPHIRSLMTSRKSVEIYDFGGGEQIYSRWQTRVQVARLTETFLAHQLGGRNGGYDYMELLAKLF